MKKTLLLAVALFATIGELAQGKTYAELIPDFTGYFMSPSGNYVAGHYNGIVSIYEVATGVRADIGNGMSDYSLGNGNCIIDNGIAVGSIDDAAVMFVKGEAVLLSDDSPYPLSYANGITPDGAMIVGCVSNMDNGNGYDGTMLVPCYWEVAADGSVGEPQLLPWPSKDFTGRAPTYVSAIVVSNDGQLIIGQVYDYSGACSYPIAFSKNDKGEWEYKLIAEELLNPEHLEFPEFPDDAPEPPIAQDYMTEDEKAAYQAAYDAWVESFYQDPYPEFEDYMSPEGIAAYNKAVEEYNKLAEDFNARLDAYFEVFEQVMAATPNFIWNSVKISSDAKIIGIGAEKRGETFWDPSENTPYTISLTDGTVTTWPGTNVLPAVVLDNGNLLASSVPSFGMMEPLTSCILRPGVKTAQPVLDFLKANRPVFAEWMEQNLRHNYEALDPETYESVLVEGYQFVGMMICNQDMNTWAGLVESYLWLDAEDGAEYSTYVLSEPGSSVEQIGSDIEGVEGVTVEVAGKGILTVGGCADTLEVFDIAGRCVFNATGVSGNVATGLETGTYIVRAGSNGNAAGYKVVF